jgi:hypothetical protein
MAGVAQFLDLGFQIGDGLLEIEVVGIHRRLLGAERGQSSAPRENS